MLNLSIAQILLAYFQTHGLTAYRTTDTKVETMHFPNERRGEIYSVTPHYTLVTYYNETENVVKNTSLSSLTDEEIKNLKGLNDSDKKAVKNYLAAKNWKPGDEIPEGCQLKCNCRTYSSKPIYKNCEQITINGTDILGFESVSVEEEKISILLKFKDEGYIHRVYVYMNINP
jgi:hypothetical protein